VEVALLEIESNVNIKKTLPPWRTNSGKNTGDVQN
jgi:hypothetical protein